MSSIPNTPNSLFLGIPSTPEFLAAVDEESISICPLLTPSPSAHFHHPLAINSIPAYERQLSPSSEDTEISTIPASIAANTDFSELDTSSKNIEPNAERLLNNGGLEGSSSSSSCSVMQDSTASAQLLNYLALSNDPSSQEKGVMKTATLLGLSKSAQEYSFVNWNWTAIRKWCFWGVMSLTVACVCVIIGYMTTIPRRCDPPRSWYQGSLIYQVFPPSFQDSDANGIGDLRGIISRIGYFEKLGAKGIRLSYIYTTQHYPEYYDRVTNLTQIDKNIGDFDDFRILVDSLHRRNISLILDLPIYPYFEQLKVRPHEELEDKDAVKHVIVNNHILVSPQNKTHIERGEVTDILTFWLNAGVDGFYLHGLQYFINDDRFITQIIEWRTELNKYNQAFDKILICSEDVVNNILQNLVDNAETKLQIIMKSFDLINVKIDPFTEGTRSIKRKLDKIQNGIIYSKPAFPWIYWTNGDIDTSRLASKAAYGNLSLAAILTTMVLPGTSGIFYGDEIALLDIHDPEDEVKRLDLKHAHHLGPMHWSDTLRGVGFSQGGVLSWLPISRAKLPISSANIIAAMSVFRDSNPGIYMKAIWKNQQILPSAAIRYIDNSVVAIERAYPRRNTYLLLANLGEKTVTRDLSSHYYGGDIVLDTTSAPGRYVTFQQTKLVPGQVVLSKLDK